MKIAILLTWSLLIAWSDLKRRKIPNELSLTAWVVGAAFLATSGHSMIGAPWRDVCGALVFATAVTLPAYSLNKLGAGDVKYLIAVGVLTSFQIALTTFVVAGLLAGIWAVCWLNKELVFATAAGKRISNLLGLSNEARAIVISKAKPRLPFGALISAGLCFALLN